MAPISYSQIYKVLLPVFFALFFCSVIFILLYAQLSYNIEKSKFAHAQQVEIETVLRNEKRTLSNLRKLLELTTARLSHSRNDQKKIQNILESIHRLTPNMKLPDIAEALYINTREPQKTISRFGQILGETSNNRFHGDKEMQIHNGHIFFRRKVLTTSGTLKGILKFSLQFDSFQKILGNYRTITYSIKDKVKNPAPSLLAIERQSFSTFRSYLMKYEKTYKLFLTYFLISICIMSCAVLFLLYAFKKTYREHIRNISNLSKRRYMKIEKLERELLESSRNYDVQEKSYQLKMQLWGEQTQQLNDNLAYPRRSLEVLAQIRLNPSKTVINIENQTEILNSCISIAELYSFSNQSKTNLSIEEIVEMVQDIFSNIVHRKKIKTSFEHDNIPEILGNPLGIKFIFLNIIGKAIYRVPKKGFIQISGIKVKDVYKITIRDNGFSLNHKQEHSLNTSYPFFLDKKAVKQLASKNHLSLKESKQNDLNETIIELHSTKNKKGTGNNVVPLFT